MTFTLGEVARMPRPLQVRRWRIKKECEAKVAHETAKDAATLMESVYDSGRAEPGTLRIYHCEFCRGWHVGHRKGTVKGR